MAEIVVTTDAWRMSVDESLPASAPLLVVPTVHPRGDRRIISCAVAALNAGYRIHFIWLGTGEPSWHPLVSETILPPPKNRRERLRSIPDVVQTAKELDGAAWHIHDYYLLPAAARWRRQTGRPVMWDSHEYYGRYYPEQLGFPRVLRPAVERALDRYEVRTVRRLGTANLVAEQMAQKYAGQPVATTVTPNFPLAASYTSQQWTPFAQRCWRVVHTGMLSHGYGNALIAQLAARSAERELPFEFHVVARFPSPDHEEEWQRLVAEQRHPKSLRMVEPMPAHKVAEFLASAGFGLSLNVSNRQFDLAIPAKSYEYVLSGIVGVLTNLDAQREFWARNGTSVVSPNDDVDELLDGMLATVGDAVSVDAVLAQQRKRGLEAFTWEGACAPDLSESFRRMRGDAARRQPSQRKVRA